jgi:hypothetical protein
MIQRLRKWFSSDARLERAEGRLKRGGHRKHVGAIRSLYRLYRSPVGEGRDPSVELERDLRIGNALATYIKAQSPKPCDGPPTHEVLFAANTIANMSLVQLGA